MDCCDNSGSTVSLKINGKAYSVRSNITVKPFGRETEAGANSDGSMYVTTKPALWEMDINFSDRCDLDLREIMTCFVDVTADLPEMGRTYLLTKARIVGKPTIKVENGEIDNIKVVCPDQRSKQVNY